MWKISSSQKVAKVGATNSIHCTRVRCKELENNLEMTLGDYHEPLLLLRLHDILLGAYRQTQIKQTHRLNIRNMRACQLVTRINSAQFVIGMPHCLHLTLHLDHQPKHWRQM